VLAWGLAPALVFASLREIFGLASVRELAATFELA
jgi:hypothetical protein